MDKDMALRLGNEGRVDVACGHFEEGNVDLFASAEGRATLSKSAEHDHEDQQQQQKLVAHTKAKKMIRKIRKKGRKKYRMLFFLAGFALLAVLSFLGVLTTKNGSRASRNQPRTGDFTFATAGQAPSNPTSMRMLSANTTTTQRNCTAIQDLKLERIAYPTSIYDTLGSSSKEQLKQDKADFCWCETTSVALNGSKVDEISTYPNDLFTMEQRRSGAIILHIILMLYCFYGLAEICDEYFESSLEELCEVMSLKPDVAGATWMAAGGSAPELFTSFMGVFVAKSDVGIGTIVGSAVFNVLFVIALCAFAAPGLALTWWPLCRDCVYYCMSILALVFVLFDGTVLWYEALVLFLMYVGYVTVMYYNDDLEKWTVQQVENQEKEERSWYLQYIRMFMESDPVEAFIYLVIIFNMAVLVYDFTVAEKVYISASMCSEDQGTWDPVTKTCALPATWLTYANHGCSAIFIAEMVLKILGVGFFGYWMDAMNAFDGVLVCLILVELALSGSGVTGIFRGARAFRFFRVFRMIRLVRLYRMFYAEYADASTQTHEDHWKQDDSHEGVTVKYASKVYPRDLLERLSEGSAKAGGTSSNAIRPAESVGGTGGTGSAGTKLESVNESKGIVAEKDTDKGNEEDAEPSRAGATKKGEEDKEDEKEGGGDDDGDDDDDDDDGPKECPLFDIPENEEGYEVMLWLITLPVSLLVWCCILDCRKEGYEKFFLVTFGSCIVLIAGLSYFMVWMAVLLGDTTGIPDPVMGLTLLAAGTSVPDAMSSIAVARRGFGDMAVSSSIGSNVFDILIGLPVPWLSYHISQMIGGNMNSTVPIRSDNISIMVLTLFIMVALTVTSIHISGWHLTKRLGYIMMMLYFAFVMLSLGLEYNVLAPSPYYCATSL